MAGHDKPKTGLQRKTPLSRSPIKRKTTRKCKVCRQEFTPWRPGVPTCDQHDCQVSYALAVAARLAAKRDEAVMRAERASIKARKEKIKTRSDWMKEAQQAFNQAIRMRDQLAGHSCISSGRPLDWNGNAVDAGHYRSVGSAPHLRFCEDNCHAQSKQDNRYGSGAAVDYRIGLIARIGLARVEALEADNEPRKHTIQDLKNIKEKYKELYKRLKNSI